jgi:hypothetical protein
MNGISLVILKNLIAELETELNAAEEPAGLPPAEGQLKVISCLNKATGLLGGVIIESSMLSTDLRKLVQFHSSPTSKAGASDIEALIKDAFKGYGGGSSN